MRTRNQYIGRRRVQRRCVRRHFQPKPIYLVYGDTSNRNKFEIYLTNRNKFTDLPATRPQNFLELRKNVVQLSSTPFFFRCRYFDKIEDPKSASLGEFNRGGFFHALELLSQNFEAKVLESGWSGAAAGGNVDAAAGATNGTEEEDSAAKEDLIGRPHSGSQTVVPPPSGTSITPQDYALLKNVFSSVDTSEEGFLGLIDWDQIMMEHWQVSSERLSELMAVNDSSAAGVMFDAVFGNNGSNSTGSGVGGNTTPYYLLSWKLRVFRAIRDLFEVHARTNILLTDATVLNDTHITCPIPRQSKRTTPIYLVVDDTHEILLAERFEYIELPVVQRVYPRVMVEGSKERILVEGYNFHMSPYSPSKCRFRGFMGHIEPPTGRIEPPTEQGHIERLELAIEPHVPERGL